MLSVSVLTSALKLLVIFTLFTQTVLPQSIPSTLFDLDDVNNVDSVEFEHALYNSSNISGDTGECNLNNWDMSSYSSSNIESTSTTTQYITVNPTSIDFGSVKVGSNSNPEIITISNNSSYDL